MPSRWHARPQLGGHVSVARTRMRTDDGSMRERDAV
jgi:hypothetical protein